MNLVARLGNYARPILLLDAALLLVGITLTAFNMLLIGWSVYAIGHIGMFIALLAIAGFYRRNMDGWAWLGLAWLLVGLVIALPQIASIWSTYLQTPSGIPMLLPSEEPPFGLLAELVTWIGFIFYGLAARGAHALPAGVGWVFVTGAVIGLLAAMHLIAPLWWVLAVLIVILGLLAVGSVIAPATSREVGAEAPA